MEENTPKEIKFTFCKLTEIKANSVDIFYFTRDDDDTMVGGSMSLDKDKAKELFDHIVKNKGELRTEEVLETIKVPV